MDSNSKSPSICQRLINFILSMLNCLPMPVEEASSRNGKSPIRPIKKPDDFEGSEIEVEFRHTDGSESDTQVNESRDSIRVPKRDGLILSNDQSMLQNSVVKRERKKVQLAPRIDRKMGTQAQGKGLQELNLVARKDAREEDLKKNIPIEESKEQKEGNHLADQETKVNNRPHEDTKPRPLRRHWPLLSVDSNINEKSDEYIQSRRKAMSKNYSHDSEKS